MSFINLFVVLNLITPPTIAFGVARTDNNCGSSATASYEIIGINDTYERLDEVVDCINQAYAKVPYINAGVTRTNLTDLKAAASSVNKQLFICLRGHEICGAVLLVNDNDKCEMGLLSVSPKYQKQQVGLVLMQHVEAAVKKIGHDHLYIKVIPLYQEKLIVYYERMGFEFTGDLEHFSRADLEKYIRAEDREKVYFRIMRKSLVSTVNLIWTRWV